MSNNDIWETDTKKPTFVEGLIIICMMMISALFFQRGKK